MKKVVILYNVEHFERFRSIQGDFFNDPSIIIYAFTYEIRYYLKHKNISYKIPEEFISEEDAEKLDNLACKINLLWHQDKFIFFNINLGICFQKTYLYYFYDCLRIIHIILNIIERENPSEIIIFDDIRYIKLYNEYISYICSLKKVYIKKIPKSNQIYSKFNENFVYKSRVKFYFSNRFKNLKFLKLFNKTLFNLIWAIIDLKINRIDKKKKNILMYGYRYHQPLIKQVSHKYNLFLLEDNTNIFKKLNLINIFKDNSGGYRLYLEYFKFKKLKKNSDQSFQNKLGIWKNLIENPEFAKTFTFQNINFFNVFKKTIYNIIFPTIREMIFRIYLYYNILKKKKIDLVIFEADNRVFDCAFSILASRMNIPTLTVQHGATSSPNAFLPLVSKDYAIWSNFIKDMLSNFNLDLINLEITGAPRMDEYFYIKKNKILIQRIKDSVFNHFGIDKNKKLILVTTTHVGASKFSSSFDLNQIEIEKFYDVLFKAIKNLPNCHLIIKLRYNDEIKKIPYMIQKEMDINNITITDDYNILDLVISCDCLISGYSTTIFEALILDKPIIIINFRNSTKVFKDLKDDIIPKVSNHIELYNKIIEYLNKPIPIKEYKDIIESYLYKIDGQAVIRIANLIDNILR